MPCYLGLELMILDQEPEALTTRPPGDSQSIMHERSTYVQTTLVVLNHYNKVISV